MRNITRIWRRLAAAAVVAAFPLGSTLAQSNNNELIVALSTPITSLDPHFHNLTPNNGLARHVFENLIATDEVQNLKPGLAESWKALDDTTWEFKLRKGVKWHDGTPFTAEDVIATFKRAPNVPNSPASFAVFVKPVIDIKAPDAHTVVMKTAAAHPLLPRDMTAFQIIPKSLVAAKTDDFNAGKAMIGTGPYKFVEYKPGDRVVFARNDAYWGPKPAWEQAAVPHDHEQRRACRRAAVGRRADDRERADRRHRPHQGESAARRERRGVHTHHLPAHGHRSRQELAVRAHQGRPADGGQPAARRARAARDLEGDQPRRDRRPRDGKAGGRRPASSSPTASSARARSCRPKSTTPTARRSCSPKRATPTASSSRCTRRTTATSTTKRSRRPSRSSSRAWASTPSSRRCRRTSSSAAARSSSSRSCSPAGARRSGDTSSPLRALVGTFDPAQGMGSANRGRYLERRRSTR